MSLDFGTIGDALKRRYEGDDAPPFDLERCARGVVPISDDEMDLALKLSAGITSWAVGIEVPALAANRSYAGLLNPNGSGIVAIIRKAWGASNGDEYAGQVSWQIPSPPSSYFNVAASATTGGPRDSRLLGQNPVLLRGGRHSPTDNSDVRGFARMPNDIQPKTVPITAFPFVLWPGAIYQLRTNAVNISILANFQWEERVIRQTERITYP